jgi:hypothetical protein
LKPCARFAGRLILRSAPPGGKLLPELVNCGVYALYFRNKGLHGLIFAIAACAYPAALGMIYKIASRLEFA